MRTEDKDATTLWAWVTRLPDGSVSQVGMMLGGIHTSAISRSRLAIEGLRPLAQSHARESGQKVWLREYTGAIDHGEA